MDRFTHAYNHEHHHAGIGLHTPVDVHYGHASSVAVQRSAALAAALLAHPNGSPPTPTRRSSRFPTTRGSTDQQIRPKRRLPNT